MRKLLESAKRELEYFLEQRDKGILVLSASGMQNAYAVKILKDIEDAGSPDIFLFFPHDFESPSHFASLVIERVKVSWDAAREELGLSEQAEGFVTLPELCLDPKKPPALRIREALKFARLLIPPNRGQRLVVVLLPLNIKDPAAYRQLIEELVYPNDEHAWFRGIRVILREDSSSPMLSKQFYRAPYTELKEIDFSTDAMIASLRDEVADTELPIEQRAQSLLQLACVDYAHKRYQEATEKYFDLLAYYQETRNPTLQAIVLNGIGDVYSRLENIELARQWYERALIPAAESANAVILFTLARNLGHIYYQLKNYSEAETFFDGAQQLGLQTRDPEAKIISLEWRGLSQEKQEHYDRAADSFEEAARLSHEFDRLEHLKRNFEQLRRILIRFDQRERLTKAKYELSLG